MNNTQKNLFPKVSSQSNKAKQAGSYVFLPKFIGQTKGTRDEMTLMINFFLLRKMRVIGFATNFAP